MEITLFFVVTMIILANFFNTSSKAMCKKRKNIYTKPVALPKKTNTVMMVATILNCFTLFSAIFIIEWSNTIQTTLFLFIFFLIGFVHSKKRIIVWLLVRAIIALVISLLLTYNIHKKITVDLPIDFNPKQSKLSKKVIKETLEKNVSIPRSASKKFINFLFSKFGRQTLSNIFDNIFHPNGDCDDLSEYFVHLYLKHWFLPNQTDILHYNFLRKKGPGHEVTVVATKKNKKQTTYCIYSWNDFRGGNFTNDVGLYYYEFNIAKEDMAKRMIIFELMVARVCNVQPYIVKMRRPPNFLLSFSTSIFFLIYIFFNLYFYFKKRRLK